MTDYIIAAIVLAIVFVALRRVKKHFRGKGGCCDSGDYQARSKKLSKVIAKKTFPVEGLCCQNCANRAIEAVQDLEGASAAVNLKKGTVTVSTDRPIADDIIREVLEKAGYPVKEVQ